MVGGGLQGGKGREEKREEGGSNRGREAARIMERREGDCGCCERREGGCEYHERREEGLRAWRSADEEAEEVRQGGGGQRGGEEGVTEEASEREYARQKVGDTKRESRT